MALFSIPAIAVTAFAMEQDRQRVYGDGFQLHIAKPIDIEKISDLIASVVSRQEECKQIIDE